MPQLINARPIGSALFNPFVLFVVSRQSPSHGLTTPVDRLLRFHALTLICLFFTGDPLRVATVAPIDRHSGAH